MKSTNTRTFGERYRVGGHTSEVGSANGLNDSSTGSSLPPADGTSVIVPLHQAVAGARSAADRRAVAEAHIATGRHCQLRALASEAPVANNVRFARREGKTIHLLHAETWIVAGSTIPVSGGERDRRVVDKRPLQ
jgi:hypothetical protein